MLWAKEKNLSRVLRGLPLTLALALPPCERGQVRLYDTYKTCVYAEAFELNARRTAGAKEIIIYIIYKIKR